MNFIVKRLLIPTPLVKNKHIGELGYTFFFMNDNAMRISF